VNDDFGKLIYKVINSNFLQIVPQHLISRYVIDATT
jgi:hypothetical protein